MNERKSFILDVHYEIIDVKNYTWVELERKYYSKSSSKPGDFPRAHYKWYIEKGLELGEWAPGMKIDDSNSNLTLKSKWQVQTKGGGTQWLESYKNNVTKEDVEVFRRELIYDISEFSPTVGEYQISTKKTTSTYMVSLPDIHFGKQSINKTFEEFDYVFHDLIDRIDNVHTYVFPIGNDLFQTEGMRQTTTRGTKVYDFSEWKLCFRSVWQHMVKKMFYLSEKKKANVIIPMVQGNHDFERVFYLGDVLYGYFRNNSNITVDNSFEPRKYFQFGKTLLAWDHGDQVKPDDYPLLMAVEEPQKFAKSATRIMFTGHLHSQQNYEIKGIHVRFLPSICPSDEWHKRKGYYSQKAGQGYKFNDNGLIGYEESRIE